MDIWYIDKQTDRLLDSQIFIDKKWIILDIYKNRQTESQILIERQIYRWIGNRQIDRYINIQINRRTSISRKEYIIDTYMYIKQADRNSDR